MLPRLRELPQCTLFARDYHYKRDEIDLERLLYDTGLHVSSGIPISPRSVSEMTFLRILRESHIWNARSRESKRPPEYSEIEIGRTMILKESWQPPDRIDTEMQALGKGNQFGVETIFGSEVAAFGTGEPQSTSILLPKDEMDAMRLMWPVFVDSSKPSDNSVFDDESEIKRNSQNDIERDKLANQNVVVESRVKVMLFADTEGSSLVNCHNPFVLCEAIAHSMIGAS